MNQSKVAIKSVFWSPPVFSSLLKWLENTGNMKYSCLMTDWPIISLQPTLKSLTGSISAPSCTSPMPGQSYKDGKSLTEFTSGCRQEITSVLVVRLLLPPRQNLATQRDRPQFTVGGPGRSPERTPGGPFFVGIVAEKWNYNNAGPLTLLGEAVPQCVYRRNCINISSSH